MMFLRYPPPCELASSRDFAANSPHVNAAHFIRHRTVPSISPEVRAALGAIAECLDAGDYEGAVRVASRVAAAEDEAYCRGVALLVGLVPRCYIPQLMQLVPNSSEHKPRLEEYLSPMDRAELAFFDLARGLVAWRCDSTPTVPPLLNAVLDDLETVLLEPNNLRLARKLMDAANANLDHLLVEIPSAHRNNFAHFKRTYQAWKSS